MIENNPGSLPSNKSFFFSLLILWRLTDINFDKTIMYTFMSVSRLNLHLTKAYLRCSVKSLDRVSILSFLSDGFCTLLWVFGKMKRNHGWQFPSFCLFKNSLSHGVPSRFLGISRSFLGKRIRNGRQELDMLCDNFSV